MNKLLSNKESMRGLLWQAKTSIKEILKEIGSRGRNATMTLNFTPEMSETMNELQQKTGAQDWLQVLKYGLGALERLIQQYESGASGEAVKVGSRVLCRVPGQTRLTPETVAYMAHGVARMESGALALVEHLRALSPEDERGLFGTAAS